jgi:glycosyltransferase involved in cell wall biosynthesis
MRRLIYIAHTPTIQIVQNCEAFAAQGVEVELWTVNDTYPDDYGAQENFLVRPLPAILFTVSALITALTSQAHIFYSQSALILLLLSLFKPRRALVYEIQQLSERGRWLQRLTARRVGTVITVTPALRDEVARMGVKRIVMANNGVKRARFETATSRIEARRALNWREEAFIVGCVGVDGVNTLMASLAAAWSQASGFQAALALIGVEDAEPLRSEWQELGLSPDLFLNTGVVPPNDMPQILSACDVCVLPLPRTEHNTFYAAPLRLFEFMASRRALIASDLPAWEDVLIDGETALLVGASDARELADAITKLYGDPLLRQSLADNAYTRVMENYTWDTRAQTILKKIFAKDKKEFT